MKCASIVLVCLAIISVGFAEESKKNDELKVDVISKPEVCEIKSKNGDMLTMHYTGTLADGTKFDSRPLPCDKPRERSFIMIKPDGVQRNLIGKIIKKFEEKGLKLVALKFMWANEDLLKTHYAELADRPFFETLVKYVGSGPVVPMVWEGPNVVKIGRKLIGATNPLDSDLGTIRGDFCLQPGRNVIHGSDSVDSAEREIKLWFKKEEMTAWRSSNEIWKYED